MVLVPLNTREIHGRVKEVEISDLGLPISDLLKKSGNRREGEDNFGFGIADCGFKSEEAGCRMRRAEGTRLRQETTPWQAGE